MISDRAWVEGMAQLVACCTSADLTPEMAHLRGRCYREDLSDLTDDGWLRAVKLARQRKWFPSVEELRELAHEATAVAGFLPPARRTDEEAEADRVAARKGLELVRSAVHERAKDLPPVPVVTLPQPRVVEATDDRLEILRRQAAEIAEQETPA